MAIDVEGNIYASGPLKPYGIYVFSPKGKKLAYIPVPEQVSNVTFGRGNDNKTLYITATTNLYKIRVNKEGYHPQQK